MRYDIITTKESVLTIGDLVEGHLFRLKQRGDISPVYQVLAVSTLFELSQVESYLVTKIIKTAILDLKTSSLVNLDPDSPVELMEVVRDVKLEYIYE